MLQAMVSNSRNYNRGESRAGIICAAETSWTRHSEKGLQSDFKLSISTTKILIDE